MDIDIDIDRKNDLLPIPIPKQIFQTHKSHEYIKQNPDIKNALNSWRRFVPEFGYFFYTNELCENFMKNEMGGEIYDAYIKLPMAVMKADLWRYCVIYKYGGIYADADTVCKYNPNILIRSGALLVIVPENSTHLCNWVFSAPKNSPILKSVIDLSVKRILNVSVFKGEHIIHHLTGPGVFTDGIEAYLEQNGKPTFTDKKKYYMYPDPSLIVFDGYVFHNKIVQHLFAGQKPDGWCKERYNKLM